MDKYLSVKTGIIQNSHLLTVDIDTWEFLDWNLDTDTYEIVAELMPDGGKKLCWIQKMIEHDNSFYFLQRNSKQIIEYNMKRKKVIRYGTEYPLGDNSCLLYCDAFIWNDNLYMLPYSVDGVITVFDIKSKKYSQEYEMKKMFAKYGDIYNNKRILSYKRNNQNIWFCIEKSKLLVFLDLLTMECNCFELDAENGLSMVTGNGRRIFCTEDGKNIFYEYDKDINLFKSFDLQRQKNKNGDGYWFIDSLDKTVIGIPKEMKSIDIIGEEGRVVQTIMFPDSLCNIFELRLTDWRFSQSIVDNNKLFFLPFSSNGLLEINLSNFDIKYHCLKIKHKDIAFSLIRQCKLIGENMNATLSDFLSFLNTFQYEKNT